MPTSKPKQVAGSVRGFARLQASGATPEQQSAAIRGELLVDYLAARDPGSFPPDSWRAEYRGVALDTPDDRPYPLP